MLLASLIVGRKNPRGDFISIDTTDILFIAGGAFAGLESIINSRLDKASIGFGAKLKKSLEDQVTLSEYFDAAVPQDLNSYGLIPEFVGRFPLIVSTKVSSERRGGGARSEATKRCEYLRDMAHRHENLLS